MERRSGEWDREMTMGRIRTRVPVGVKARIWSGLLLAPQCPLDPVFLNQSVPSRKMTSECRWIKQFYSRTPLKPFIHQAPFNPAFCSLPTEKSHLETPLEENVNRIIPEEGSVEARTIEDAISVLRYMVWPCPVWSCWYMISQGHFAH